ncbi:hypothetical protein J6590_042860 [Homalodisca vitripennis]|nr:hypothetical protein J6590_042860 [Homalodisca vitripennis]
MYPHTNNNCATVTDLRKCCDSSTKGRTGTHVERERRSVECDGIDHQAQDVDLIDSTSTGRLEVALSLMDAPSGAFCLQKPLHFPHLLRISPIILVQCAPALAVFAGYEGVSEGAIGLLQKNLRFC